MLFGRKKDGDYRDDPDVRLMLTFQNGSDADFNPLMERFQMPLARFAALSVGTTAAEDVVQEVFLRVYRAKKSYRPRARFSTWIFRIARSVCIDHLRKHRHRTVSLDDEGHQHADASSPDGLRNVENSEAGEAIRLALNGLPPAQRMAISLKLQEDKSYAEIAAILECSVSAVESLIFRARQNLKTALAPYRPD